MCAPHTGSRRVHPYAAPAAGSADVGSARAAQGRMPTVAPGLCLRFGGPALARQLDARYAAASCSELHVSRLVFLVFAIVAYGTGLVIADRAPTTPGLAVSLVTSFVSALLLYFRPAYGDGVAAVATTVLILGLDMQHSVLVPASDGPDLATTVGVMPFVFCAMLSPRVVRALPILFAHTGYAAYLLLIQAPADAGAKALVTTLCTLLTCGHLWVTQRGRMERAGRRALLGYRLEQAVTDREVALAEGQKYAHTLDHEIHRFESAG